MEIYKEVKESIIPSTEDCEHTMKKSLKGYVDSKFDAKQDQMIFDAIIDGYDIEVRAYYDIHFIKWLELNCYQIIKKEQKKEEEIKSLAA